MRLTVLLLVQFVSFASNGFYTSLLEYPRPSGPHQVGVLNNVEIQPTSHPEFDKFLISIYYPAQLPANETEINALTAGYLDSWQGLFGIADDPEKRGCAQEMVPWLYSPLAQVFKQIAWVGTNFFLYASARPNLPVLRDKKKFPVVIFSHGFASFHAFHLALIQELASHGFIVVGIDHTCGQEFARNSRPILQKYVQELKTCRKERLQQHLESCIDQADKELVKHLKAASPLTIEAAKTLDGNEYYYSTVSKEYGKRVLECETLPYLSLDEKKKRSACFDSIRDLESRLEEGANQGPGIHSRERRKNEVGQRVTEFDETIRFLMNHQNSNNIYEAMDFRKIGIIGQSLGGEAAIWASAKSEYKSRFKALVSLDGYTPPEEVHFSIPSLILLAKWGNGKHGSESWLNSTFGDFKKHHAEVKIFDVNHVDFSDLSAVRNQPANFHNTYLAMVLRFLERFLCEQISPARAG